LLAFEIIDFFRYNENYVSFTATPYLTKCLLGDSGAHDTAELVSGLFGGDAVDSESSLDVIDKTEVFIGLLDGDDVHESSGEVHISSHFAVNFDQSLHEDFLDLIPGKGVVKSVTEEDDEWETLALFVRSLGGLGRIDSGQFVQHPVAGSIKAL